MANRVRNIRYSPRRKMIVTTLALLEEAARSKGLSYGYYQAYEWLSRHPIVIGKCPALRPEDLED